MSAKRKKYVLITAVAAGLVLLVPVAMLVVLATINLNNYKPQIEHYFHIFTGRELKLGGNIAIDLINRQLIARLQIDHASISNAPWGLNQPMLDVGKLKLELPLKPLLKKRLLIDIVQIENLRVIVENNTAGISNWFFNPEPTHAQSAVSPAETTSNTHVLQTISRFLPVIRQLTLNNIRIHYIDHQDTIDSRVWIKSLRLKEEKKHLSMIEATGRINDEKFNFNGKVSRVSHILKDDPLNAFLYGNAAGIALYVEGKVTHPLTAFDLNLDVKLKTDDINKVITVTTGKRLLAAATPLTIHGHINSKNQQWTLEDLDMQLADSDIHGRLAISLDKPVPMLSAKLYSNRINLNKLKLNANKVQHKSRQKKSRQKKIEKTTRQLLAIPALSLRFKQLEMFNANLDVDIKKLLAGKIKTANNHLQARLQKGKLDISHLKFDYSQGSVSAQSSFYQQSALSTASLNLTINKINLATVLKSFGVKAIKKGGLNSRIKLVSKADNLRDLVNNAHGSVTISGSNIITGQTLVKNRKPAYIIVRRAQLAFSAIKKPAKYSVTATINRRKVSAQGKLDSIYKIITAKPYTISSHLQGVGVNSNIKADFLQAFDLHAITRQAIRIYADIKIKNPLVSLRQAKSFLPKLKPDVIKHMPVLPVSIKTRLEKTNRHLNFTDTFIVVGKNNLHGNISINRLTKPVSIRATLKSSYINLNQFISKTKKVFSKKASTKQHKKIKLFSDKPFPDKLFKLKSLKNINATVKLDAGKVELKSYTVNELHVLASIKKSMVKFSPLVFDFSGGHFSGNASITRPEKPIIKTSWIIKHFDYGKFQQTPGQEGIISGKMDVNLNLAATGNSPHKLASSLNGDVLIRMQDGRLNSHALNLFSTNLANLLPLPGNKHKQRIRCGVVNVKIKQGIVTSQAIIFDTGLVSVLGTGMANLNQEKLDFYIEPHAKNTSIAKLALIPVDISGTLSSPTIEPNLAGTTLSTAKSAIHIGLAIATGGISLVAEGLTRKVYDTIIDANDYCAIALSGKPIKVVHINLLPAN